MNHRIAPTMIGAALTALAACSPAAIPGPDAPTTPTASKTLLPPPPPAPTEYSGRATAVDAVVRILLVSVDTRLGDTGPLPSSGGSLAASLLTASVPGILSAGVAQGSTNGGGNDASSGSSLADVALNVGGVGISASLLSSATDASCASGAPVMTGSSAITALTINGRTIDVTGAPNQSITLLGGLVRVIVNEQRTTSNSIDVSALHVIAAGAADVTIAKTHSDITCGS